ncbi:MAG TPA: DUF268 domain-containing protein [Armatimonadota bacterium]
MLQPEDFQKNYSPLREAQLTLHIIDEQPRCTPRNIARAIRDWLLLRIGDINDLRAEQAWRTIRKRWGTITPEHIYQYLGERWAHDIMRTFEYSFQARCLLREDVHAGHIVDLGGGYSYSTVVPMLLQLPEATILSLDVMHHQRRSRYGVRYVCGNCIETNLPAESADVVTLISTLEHVGLGRYGDPLAVDGDIRTMREAHRILKPGGHVILTVPYGYPTVVFNMHRIYDDGRFGLVTQGFTPVLTEYSLHGKLASQAEAEAEFMHKHPDLSGGIMALLRKTG